MKKVLCLIFCLLFLGGCGKDKITDVEKEPLIISGFSAVASTSLNGTEISADVKYNACGELLMTVISPETFKGTVISCKDGECQITYDALTFNLPDGKLSPNMLCKALEECLNNVLGKTPVENDDGFFVYTYEFENGIYHLYTDSQKRFVKLVTDGKETVTFSNFTYISE